MLRNRLPQLINFLYSIAQDAVMVLVPAYLTTASGSAVLAGAVRGIFDLARLPGAFLPPLLEARFGIRLQLIGLSALTGMVAVLLTRPDLPAIITVAAFGVAGLCAAAFSVALNAFVANSSSQKTAAIARLQSVLYAGSLLGLAGSAFLVTTLGMIAMFWIWAAFCLVVGLFAIGLREPVRSLTVTPIPFRTLLRAHFPTRLVIIVSLAGLLAGVRGIAIPIRISEVDLGSVSLTFAIASFATMIGIVPLGKFADSHGALRLAAGGFLSVGIAQLLVPFIPLHFFPFGVITGVLLLGQTAVLIACRSAASDWSAGSSLTGGVALINAVFFVTKAIGGIASGWALSLDLFTALSIGVGLLSLAGIVLTLVKPSTPPASPTTPVVQV